MTAEATWADLLTPTPATHRTVRLAPTGPVTDRERRYGRTAVEKAAARLAATPEGARDETLVGDACSTAGRCLAAGGCLDDTDFGWAVGIIEQAGRTAGLTDREVAKVAGRVRAFSAASTDPIRPPADSTQAPRTLRPASEASRDYAADRGEPPSAAADDGSAAASTDIPPPGNGGWGPVDLAPFLDGTYSPPQPSLLLRHDNRALIYPGRVHWCAGEPEALKSWLAQLLCAQVLLDGNRAVYVDFEDGPGGVTARLLALGVPAAALLQRFTYVSPTGQLTPARRDELTPVVQAAAAVIVDACTEALAGQGLSSKDDTDIAAWLEMLPRWAARHGPAVLVLDHVVKDVDSRGRWATGSQHKLAGLDGVAFTLEAVQRGGVGLTGRSRLWVEKDRHGQVRGAATVRSAGDKHWAADLVVDSTGPFLDVTLAAPTAQPGLFRPTGLMQRISEVLAAADRPLSGREIDDRVPGKAQTKRQALAALVDDGHVAAESGPRGSHLHHLVKPYPTTGGTP